MTEAAASATGPAAPRGGTRERILDAALAVLSERGLAAMAVEDVAQQAGVSRQTVYRHMGSREGLVTATILREEAVLLARMGAAVDPSAGLEPALRDAIAELLVAAREHPLLDRLVASEPEALLPFVTDGRGPVVSAAKPMVRGLLGQWVSHLGDTELDFVAEAATRLISSYAISPPPGPSEDLADGLARLIARGLQRQ